MKMPNKFFLTLKLMRVDKPTGYFLVFFPAFFGLLLARPSLSEFIKLLPLFILGSITTRSGGCIINDLFDRDFDKKIERTKDRPLANKKLSISYSFVILAVLAICSLLILLSLNKTCIILGFGSVIMIILYPLMKRFTYFPQAFLGLTFNMGVLIGYAAILDKITLPAILMYLACCSWTIGYDAIYGFMDLKDDKKINVKSISTWLEGRNYSLWLGIFYVIFITLFTLSCAIAHYQVNYIIIFSALILLLWQVITLEIHDPNNCLIRFKNNNYVGFVLSLGLLL